MTARPASKGKGFPSQSMDDLGKRAAFARLAWRLGGWTPKVDRERSGGQGLPCPGRAGESQAPLVLGAIGGGGGAQAVAN